MDNFVFSYEDVSRIVRASKDKVESSRNYQMLYRRFLQELWEKQLNHKIFFSIYISPEAVERMCFEGLTDRLSCIFSCLTVANLLQIDEYGNVIAKNYIEGETNEIKLSLEKLSLNNFVFFFGERGITKYINGHAVEDNNIFYSRLDEMKFVEKKDISRIDEVMDDYSRQFVTQQVNYMSFFADNSTLRQIMPGLEKRNILRNKPEHYMRDQLCQYLTDHMRYTFTIEPELGQSKRELDIYFDVCGELYFIEIKWLGESVNDQGTGLSTEYGDARAREGVTQTLEYIEELMNTSEKSLRCGYLTIYDARDDKNEIDFKEYSFVDERLKCYMQNFQILKVIPLVKRHSA